MNDLSEWLIRYMLEDRKEGDLERLVAWALERMEQEKAGWILKSERFPMDRQMCLVLTRWKTHRYGGLSLGVSSFMQTSYDVTINTFQCEWADGGGEVIYWRPAPDTGAPWDAVNNSLPKDAASNWSKWKNYPQGAPK